MGLYDQILSCFDLLTTSTAEVQTWVPVIIVTVETEDNWGDTSTQSE